MDEPKLKILTNNPEATPDSEVQLTTQQEILNLVTRNIYTDAILQSIGLIVLGAAVRSKPSLNEREHYADELDPDVPDATDCDIHFEHIVTIKSGELLTHLDKLINKVANALEELVVAPDYERQMIAGTLRIHLAFAKDIGMDSIHFNLMWIEKQKAADRIKEQHE